MEEVQIAPYNQVLQEFVDDEIGTHGELALTRVMSPNYYDQQAIEQMHEQLQFPCVKCSGIVFGPTPMCSHCGRGGHVQCIGLSNFHGLLICSQWYQMVTLHYAELEKNQRHNEWMLYLAQQLGSMKTLATRVMGASASVGVAVGGAAGTVAGAAIAGVQGVVQGVSHARASQPALPDAPALESSEDDVPPPPEPFVEEVVAEESTTVSKERCLRCDGNKRMKHTFRGLCEGWPAAFYFSNPGSKGSGKSRSLPVEDVPRATEASSTGEQPPVARAPGEVLDTEMVREMNPSPQEQEAAITAPIPVSVPNSFGSATSMPQQTFFPRAGEPRGTPAPDTPTTSRRNVSPDDVIRDLVNSVRHHREAADDLRRAIKELQDSNIRLDGRVSELEAIIYHQQQSAHEEPPTPRSGWYTDHSAEADVAATAEWGHQYDLTDQGAQIPPVIHNLANHLSQSPPDLGQEGPSVQSTGPGTSPLTDNTSQAIQPARESFTGVGRAESPEPPRADTTLGGQEANALASRPQVSEITGISQPATATERMLPTDRDVFTYLAGARENTSAAAPQAAATPTVTQMTSRVTENMGGTHAAESIAPSGQTQQVPPGLSMETVSPPSLSTSELGFLLKILQTNMKEFPKLESGDPATKGQRLRQWKVAIETTLLPAGDVMVSWWRWCIKQAEEAYTRYINTDIHLREAIYPTEKLPSGWLQIDSWLKPRLLEVVPHEIREWQNSRIQQGLMDDTQVILFYVMKRFAPGNADERVHLLESINNPKCCSKPKAALAELTRWKELVRRSCQLGMSPPDMMLTYRALTSIFSDIFDAAEPRLNTRWIQLQNRLGVPYKIELSSMMEVAKFAEDELQLLVVQGNTAQNIGLPPTDNQLKKNKQAKENEEKRAASAHQKIVAQLQKDGQAQPPTARATLGKNGKPSFSNTLSKWAAPCPDWHNKGFCKMGCICPLKHTGFPYSEKRCLTCGHKNHESAKCTAPGGAMDPKRIEHWKTYTDRRDAALAKASGGGQGNDGGNPGSGKPAGGKDGGKGKEKGDGKKGGGKGDDKNKKGKGKDGGKGAGQAVRAAYAPRVPTARSDIDKLHATRLD